MKTKTKKILWIAGVGTAFVVGTILDVIIFSKHSWTQNEDMVFKITYYTFRNMVEFGLFGLGWFGNSMWRTYKELKK